MKKSILILSFFLSVSALQAQQAGLVRIYFTGFHCIKEAADDDPTNDGPGNEVYFQFHFSHADLNGTLKRKDIIQTDVYGDNSDNRFSYRILAGSAHGLPFGRDFVGITSNDKVTTYKFVSEYNLAAGDILSCLPTIWEWNLSGGNEGTYNAMFENSIGAINTNAAAHVKQRFPNLIPPGTFNGEYLNQLISLDGSSSFGIRATLKITGEIPPKSHPIGVRKDGTFSPRVILFTGNNLQAIANTNFGYGIGVVPVQYNDLALGNDRDHGNYIVMMKVEFIPASVPATTNNPPVNTPPSKTPPADPVFNRNINTNRTIPAGSVPKKAATSFTNEFLTGVWKGTMGTLSSATDGPLSFRINNNVFWALDKNGATTAAGSYQLLNGGFTAVYYDSNNWKYVFTSTGYNNGTGEISGNWTCEGPNYYKTGKWIAKKVSN